MSATLTLAAHVEPLPGAAPEDWTGGPQGSGLLMLTLPALMPLAYCEARSGDDCAGFEVWVEEVLAVTLAVVLARIPEGVLAVEQPSHHTQGVDVGGGLGIACGGECEGGWEDSAPLRDEHARSKDKIDVSRRILLPDRVSVSDGLTRICILATEEEKQSVDTEVCKD